MSDPVSVHEAKTRFSMLVARVEAGEEIVVRGGPTPVAKLVAYVAVTRPRTPGRLRPGPHRGRRRRAPTRVR